MLSPREASRGMGRTNRHCICIVGYGMMLFESSFSIFPRAGLGRRVRV
jgi:hypothetical protein